jgi:hypothetical protein
MEHDEARMPPNDTARVSFPHRIGTPLKNTSPIAASARMMSALS